MRILVVEDEQNIRKSLKSGLEAECFAVDTAEDGEQGLTLASTDVYDLIILDNVLPEKTGAEICRELREQGKSVPILMLSVQSEVTTKVQMLNYGADDYLTKPFSFAELSARVRALLRRPEHIADEVLHAGELTLDTKRHIVTYKDTEVDLTRKEFMLLEYLMKNIGIVLSRNMIMEHVWDMNADPFSNTIESHVMSLRKKIWTDIDTKDRPIKTVSGRGYKLEIH